MTTKILEYDIITGHGSPNPRISPTHGCNFLSDPQWIDCFAADGEAQWAQAGYWAAYYDHYDLLSVQDTANQQTSTQNTGAGTLGHRTFVTLAVLFNQGVRWPVTMASLLFQIIFDIFSLDDSRVTSGILNNVERQ